MVGSSLPTHRELVDALEALADAVLKSEGLPRPLVALSEDARNRARQYKTALAEKLVSERGASRVPLLARDDVSWRSSAASSTALVALTGRSR